MRYLEERQYAKIKSFNKANSKTIAWKRVINKYNKSSVSKAQLELLAKFKGCYVKADAIVARLEHVSRDGIMVIDDSHDMILAFKPGMYLSIYLPLKTSFQ